MAKPSPVNIPHPDRIVRYVPYSRIRRDEDAQPIGVLPAAFALRPGEAYLSAGWLDHYTGSDNEKFAALVSAYDASPLTIKDSGGFAVGPVEGIKETCTSFGQSIRVVSEPKPNMPGYVAVRKYRSDDADLLAMLADESWSHLKLVSDAKAG